MKSKSTDQTAPPPNMFHAIVRGKVQGVGFRVFVREAALRMGCTGWVRNLDDGSVEVSAESDEMTLTELLTEISKGPPWAHVQAVDITWDHRPPEGERFRILR